MLSSDDWTSRLPSNDHINLFRNIDWASTDLGPLQEWGASLRFAANLVFTDSRGACVYWGPKRVAFYNQQFMVMAGEAHPTLMGQPFAVGFPELAADINPLFDKAEAEGMTLDVENIPLITERNGYLEETYFIGQFIPLRGDSGDIQGFYNTVYESTFRVLHDRRRAQLDLLSAVPSCPVSSLFQHLVEALKSNSRDVPMMLLYSADETGSANTCVLTLQGSIGIPQNHKSAPMKAELHQSDTGFVPLFREARSNEAPLVVGVDDGGFAGLASDLLEGIEWAGFGEPSKTIVIAPLADSTRLFGFVILGTNPRRLYDASTKQFVSDICQQFLTKWNNAVSAEEARSREQKLLKDLEASERRIHYMAKYAPVGMVHVDIATKTMVWANDQYYDITGASKAEVVSSLSFFDVYAEEDQPEAKRIWERLEKGEPYCSGQLRLKRRFIPPSGQSESMNAWVLAHGFLLKENGEIKYIMGCLTDVSHLKWAELLESRSAAAAREAKRQQSEFSDVTSHELRNPLGAMMQSADSIAKSLQNPEVVKTHELCLEALRENIEAANTILNCAAHQKRIIDDVLLLSKLEFKMLSITPVRTELSTVVKNVVDMFKGELTMNEIEHSIQRHPSVDKIGLDWVYCDPSRLAQILINVIGNGIKYVRGQARKEMKIIYGAASTLEGVRRLSEGIRWCPTHKQTDDLTQSPDWGTGDPAYLFFSISDSGPGLKSEEIDNLFQRFVQATRLTHVYYGGSGLGLYISRELAEKQGGEIGVSSEAGDGATFSFYVKVRQADPKPPVHDVNTLPLHQSMRAAARANLSILLVEDNIVNQKILRKQLKKNLAGCTVHVANHGLEALDFLERTDCWKGQHQGVPLDIILLDWEMPVLNGLETSKRIRRLESEGTITQHKPIIAITANARSEQIQNALEVGMNDVLPKPFVIDELIAKIHEWTSKGM